MRQTILLSIPLLLLLSCGTDYYFDESYDLANEEWTYDNTLQFDVDIQDTLKIYNLYLEISHSAYYGFQNLYTRIYTQFPSGNKLEEMVSFELADKTGRWLGDCNGQDCTLLIPIQTGAYFSEEGIHQITLEQFMRKNPLAGLQSIAFKIEATDQSR